MSEARNRLRSYGCLCGGLVLALLVFALGGEALFRLKGLEAWKPAGERIHVSPSGTLFEADPLLGYAPKPGQYMVTIDDAFRFTMTHDAAGERLTAPKAPPAALPEIWIFGCSFTHGWGVDDAQSYPWLLGERVPGFRVRNLGVSGYGTVHALLAFRQALEQGGKPVAAILAYAHFHDIRNTFLRKRRKAVAAWSNLGPVRQPYARLDAGTLRIHHEPIKYYPPPLVRHSALVNHLDSAYNEAEYRRHNSHEVSEALVAAMHEEAEAAGVRLLVVGIVWGSDTAAMLEFASSRGIATADIALDLDNRENTNYPYDRHPNGRAMARYAERIAAFIEEQGVLDKARE